MLYLGSPHTVCSQNSALKINFDRRNRVQLRSAEEKKSSHLTRVMPPASHPQLGPTPRVRSSAVGWAKGLSSRALRSCLQGGRWGALPGLSVGAPVTQQVLCRVGFLEKGASMGLLSAQNERGGGSSGESPSAPSGTDATTSELCDRG